MNKKTPAEIIVRHREAFYQFMKLRKLNANNWSKMAGVAEATIRHYLSGRNHSITMLNLELLAQAAGANLSDIVSNDDNIIDSVGLNTNSVDNEFELQHDLFVQAYKDFHALQSANLDKSLQEQASAIFSWYQLVRLYQQTGQATPSPEEIGDILYKK